MQIRTLHCTVLVICLAALAGCSSAYYSTLEKVGIHKRDLMVSRVEDARDAQAISSLKNELVAIEDNVAGLVSEMEASIKEAEQFIESLRREG
jgi:hypothetical protein